MNTVPTFSTGGVLDSSAPRKVHAWNFAAGKTLCGQAFRRVERGEVLDTPAENFTGSEVCRKCAKKLARNS